LKEAEERRLVRLTKICLALPEAVRECHGSHATFLVRKRVFAYYLNDHHGDGIVSIACKVLPGDNTALAAAQPGRFYLPAYVGARGWVALRLDVGEVDWDEVAELAKGSYRMVCGKRLAALVDSLDIVPRKRQPRLN
jgi:hypothetical protein